MLELTPRERFDASISALCNLRDQIEVSMLAVATLETGDAARGHVKVPAGSAIAISSALRYIAGDLMVQINELETNEMMGYAGHK